MNFKSLLFVGFGMLIFGSASAAVRLPMLIKDSMVLQRDAKVKIWGWASGGEKITVSFAGKKYKATTAADGRWQLTLSPTKAGGPYTMNIDASNHIVLKEILVGDVWFCSGQSNMVHQMELHKERYAKEIANANDPQIRHFWIPTLTDLQQPKDDLPNGYWKSANPRDIGQFSAVAYFFAKTIYDKYHIPIGLINASVGGTPIEAWTSEEGLKDFSSVISTIEKNKDTAYVNNINRIAFAAAAGAPKPNDKGLTGTKPWFDPNYIANGWQTINIPGYWEDQGVKDLDGIVWYRREVDIPASMANMAAKVALGRIVDADQLYINGKPVGSTGYQYPQRRYQVPAGLLKTGKNIFVVRVTNNFGKGGFVPNKPYYVATANDTIDLKGDWQYKVGDVFIPRRMPAGLSAQNQPTALYNAMVAPVINYTIKGIVWYQGETNVGNAQQYAQLLPALIKDWRTKWNLGDIPFIYAQLPNYGDAQYLPSESSWAVLQQAQLKTLSVPNTGMAVTIGLGEWNDIHPDNKKDVGVRLALNAEKLAYNNNNIVYSGPLYQSASIDANKIIITFSNVGSGLTTNDNEPLNHFAIAGADKKFVWAKATIEGNTVVVTSNAIANPLYVRYAWADSPVGANLYNKEGLPASPFKTDE